MLRYSRRQFGGDFDCFDSCLQVIYPSLGLYVASFDTFQSSGKLGYYCPLLFLFGMDDLFYSLR